MSKKTELRRIIYGLGIRNVGTQSAEVLAEEFGSIDELIKASSEEA